MRNASAGEGGGGGGVGRVKGLIGFEFGEEGVEGAQVFVWGLGVQVEDGGDGVAEEKIVCSSAGELARFKVGEAREVVFGEVKGIEPVYSTFVTETCSELGMLVQ